MLEVEAVVEVDAGIETTDIEGGRGGRGQGGKGGYRKSTNTRGLSLKVETKEMNGNVFQTHSEQRKRG